MAGDSKSSMGLWSSTHQSIGNIKQDLLGIGSVVQNQVLPQLQKMSDLLKSSRPGGKGNRGDQVVADNGVKESVAGGPSDNKVAQSGAEGAGGAGGGGGGGKLFGGGGLSAGATALAAADALANFLPGTNVSVLQDLLTQRSAFYGQGGYSGSLQDRTGRVRSLEKSLANNGTAISPMDTTRALAQAQASGLTGATNFNQVMQGAAQASNFVPGMGVEAVTASVGGVLNSANTVNLARTIGINIRDSNGNMLPLPQLVDRIWNYLKQTSGASGLNKKDMEFSFQPGYGLYNMVNGLVGGDPSTFTIVKNMLLAKAEFGGKPLASITKDQMVAAGIQSAASRNIASQTAAQTGVLVSTSAAAAGGAAIAADVGTGLNRLAAAMSDLTAVFAGANGFLNGLKNIGQKAAGGPVGNNTPYIVGEVGPELFIPKTDGVIIPNKDLNSMHRANGGSVSAFESSFFKDIKAPNTAANRAILEQWMRYESGNDPMRWNNPMNSELAMSGSTKANKAGVQKYKTIAQGAMADANTLLNTKGIGYDKILSAFRAGDSSDKTWAAIVQSGWVTGKVDPNRTAYSPGSTSSDTTSGGEPAKPKSTSMTGDPTAASRFAAATSAAFGGGAGMPSSNNYNYNYGGVTIQISGAQDPKKVAQEVNTNLQKLGKK